MVSTMGDQFRRSHLKTGLRSRGHPTSLEVVGSPIELLRLMLVSADRLRLAVPRSDVFGHGEGWPAIT